jgi:uncharacterized membrane protein (DUF2068 family)
LFRTAIPWRGKRADSQMRPAGVAFLSCFFLFGLLASGLAALMLLLPGTLLDVLWRFNPHSREGLLAIGNWAVLLMSTACLACAVAALGLWRLRRWGLWTATAILSINLIADTINALVLRDWRTLIGLPIAGLMIAYLMRHRSSFAR